MKQLILWCAAALLSCACSTPYTQEVAQKTAEVAIGVVQELIAADNARDLDRALSCYADDALWFPPSGDTVQGKAAIAERYRDLFARFDVSLKVDVSECEPAGEWAYIRGSTRGTLKPNDGTPPVVVDDTFVAILKRGGEHGWEISSLTWSPRGTSRP